MRAVVLRILIVMCLLAAVASVYAALGQDLAPLVHDGRLILTIRVAEGGMSAWQRMEAIQLRMQDLMEKQFANESRDIIGQLQVGTHGAEVVIASPYGVLVTVTQADARVNNSSREGLARYWRERLVRVLNVATKTG